MRIPALILATLALTAVPARGADEDFFEAKIRPVLASVCLKCHGGDKTSSQLSVASRDALLEGGERGPAIVPGSAAGSLLMRALRHGEDAPHMPPDKPLSAEQLRDFEAWIESGASWPEAGLAGPGGKHWAFQRVQAVQPPQGAGAEGAAHPIDRFVSRKLDEHGLEALGRAGKRTLIRRAAFDLTGLPPTPAEVQAFLSDESPTAFSAVVDRLLASPHYGEKWARHWLDIVRYADTAGETADFPVPQAWRYRNYVIGAFNQDKPYDEFVREQIAGDILADQGGVPANRYAELVTATGFIAIARRFGFDSSADHYLTIDDTIDTLSKSILGLTVGCARCHDHKYDPISAADYYGLYGIFASTRYPFPGCEKEKVPRDMAPLLPPRQLKELVKPIEERLAALDASIGGLRQEQTAAAALVGERADEAAVTLAAGEIADAAEQGFDGPSYPALGQISVEPGHLIGLEVSPLANHGGDSTLVELVITETGSGSRTWSVTSDLVDDMLAGNPHPDAHGNPATWWLMDLRRGAAPLPEGISDLFGNKGLHIWRNGDTPSAFVNASPMVIHAWAPLEAGAFFVHPAADGPVGVTWVSPLKGTISIAGRVADAHPGGADGVAWRIEHAGRDLRGELGQLASKSGRLAALVRERADVAAAMPEVPAAYAVSEATGRDACIHIKGDPESVGERVPRRFPEVLGGQKVGHQAGSGRLELAGWLTSRDNPLTARVMVNRVWQHHFGAGLVDTPNDFGTRGSPPTHPELLDYLAARFMREGWSIKAMHRLIMSSQAYQRGGGKEEALLAAENEQVDPANAWLWRFARRRLSAEEIRDAILAVSGGLDRSQGAAHPFPAPETWSFTQHSPFTAVYEHPRRSIYLMTQRIKRHPFLGLFDGADTSASTAERFTTTVPVQALFFLNDPFVHEQAQRLAERLLELAEPAERLESAFGLLYGRRPSESEMELAAAFIERYASDLPERAPHERSRSAWEAWLRVMFGSNEFLYVD